MRQRDLGFNPLTGVQTIYHSDGYGEEFVVEMKQDVQPIAEDNLLQRNAAPSTWKGDGFHRVASIPWSVYAQLAKQPNPFVTASARILDHKRYAKWLNSAEALPWRTKTGKI